MNRESEAASDKRVKKAPGKRRPYIRHHQGDVFLVPLRNGGWAVGVVALKGPSGQLGYFFGPKFDQEPTLSELTLDPSKAIFIAIFGEYDLKIGAWKIIGRLDNLERTRWTLPLFQSFDWISEERFAVEYTEDNFVIPFRRLNLPDEELDKLPESGSWGSGAVEEELTRLLEQGPN